jgi:hypothetical protein
MHLPANAVRAVVLTCVAFTWTCGGEARSPAATSEDGAGAPVAEAQGGPEIYLRQDFDSGQNPFGPTESSQVALVSEPDHALSGRSLQIRRGKEGRYIGASVPLRIKGAKDLRIAFVTRAKAMQTVAVNVFDQRRQDNTTPASPARVFDDNWHPVVFAVEDFHYNSDPPDRKIELETDFGNLLFHGREDSNAAELLVDKLVIYRGHDAVPPGPPTAVQAAAGNDGSVTLSWQEPSDNTFAVVYSVYRKSSAGAWTKVGESLRPTYRDHPGAEAHAYRVTAADYENNVSAPSAEATVQATAGVAAPSAAPPPWVSDRSGYAENVRRVHARGRSRVRPDVFLFAGDSLTAATLYTHVLGSWLARGLTVRQGVGTVTTAYGAENIKAYLTDARPEFAVVLYGTNDVERRVSESESVGNLGAVVDACLEFGTVPVLTTIPPRGDNKGRQGEQERFNRALVELARRKQVPVSYAFEEMMQHELGEMLFDGVHLQPEAGNDAAGRALRRTMDQVYFALRDSSGSW